MNMKMKRFAVVLAAAALALPMASCGKGGSNQTTTTTAANAETTGRDRSSEKAQLESQIVVDPSGMIDAGLMFVNDPGEADDSNPFIGTSPAVVTTMIGTDGNAYVAKTDINGTNVTEEGGDLVTELFTGTASPASYAEPDYVPEIKSYLSMWVDTSKQSDYVFNGEFLNFEIKVKDDAKDGIYPIDFYWLDFSDYDGNIPAAESTMGYICINSSKPDEPSVGSGLTVVPGIVEAKPGDTIQYPVSIKNNTGLTGFVLRFSYDSKAFEIVKGSNGKDFDIKSKITNKDN